MKLRNKKTGEIIDLKRQVMAPIVVRTDAREVDGFSSIAELNEEWEDYQPKEPLIKDEKIQQFIRDYFEIWSWKIRKSEEVKIEHYDFRTKIYNDTFELVVPKIEELDISRHYTVTELCGEEEE